MLLLAMNVWIPNQPAPAKAAGASVFHAPSPERGLAKSVRRLYGLYEDLFHSSFDSGIGLVVRRETQRGLAALPSQSMAALAGLACLDYLNGMSRLCVCNVN